MKRLLCCFLVVFVCIVPKILLSQNVSITGTVDAATFSGTHVGTITTPAQPNITSLGTLTGLTVSGTVSFTNIGGTLTTAAQPNITSIGTLSNLTVTGLGSFNTISGTLTTGAQPNITSIGTLSNLTVTGLGSFSTISGTLTTAAQPNITSIGTLSNLTVTGLGSFSTISGTLTTVAQPNITSIGILSNLTVTNVVNAGSISTALASGSGGVLQLRETGGEYGEAGLYVYNKTGSNGPIFYTNPTNPAIDLVDFGFLSLGSNSQTNIRFEHRAANVLDVTNTNGEMQIFHITNNGAAATPSTAFAGIGSATTTINSTNAVVLNGGTGASVFSTSGAGTLVLGGASSTGAITLGQSSGTQTVNVGTGTGASTVNIATGSTNANTVNIGTGAVANTITLGNVTGATAVNINAGTGASSFATTGAGTLVLGGASSTGAITIGSSSSAQTVNIGTGAGASTINIGTASSTPKITLSGASVSNGAGVRIGNARFTVNKPTTPVTGLNANTSPTVTQILEAGIFGFASTTARTLTLPTAQGATGLVQALPRAMPIFLWLPEQV